ncbi:RNI-like protein, partial [Nadsonia fulvescens var. elongata DSM 6958]
IPLDLIARFREFPLFNSAPDVFLVAITFRIRLQLVNPQEYIITEGEEAKAMYWILRGTVGITSRDGEALYAELSQGAFFGEIGILFDRPRTATVVACTRCMLVVLTADALNNILPSFPRIERAIRDEAQERLAIIEKRRQRARILLPNSNDDHIVEANLRVRDFLIQVPLFASLPEIIIHKLALSVDPKSYAPFECVIKQNSVGQDIYFVTSGIVEVVDEISGVVKARLSDGTYFGEIAFLLSTPRRTASVRCVTMVDCLVLTGNTLNLLCDEYPEIMTQIEAMAQSRINDINTRLANSFDRGSIDPRASPALVSTNTSQESQTLHQPLFTSTAASAINATTRIDGTSSAKTKVVNAKNRTTTQFIPDFSNYGVEGNIFKRKLSIPIQTSSKARRFSMSTLPSQSQALLLSNNCIFMLHPRSKKRTVSSRRRPSLFNVGPFSDSVQVKIFQYLPLPDLMRFQRVCQQWQHLLLNSYLLLHELILTPYNTTIDDKSIVSIVNFAGQRPKVVDISNCFHLTDEGFTFLVNGIGLAKIQIFKMKSVWEVSAMAIMDLTVPSIGSDLEEIDLSNCRKVNDATLERLIGWVVPESSQSNLAYETFDKANNEDNGYSNMAATPGTIVGCCQLKRVSLSYCKHITDRSMYHISACASNRLESLDLTRCTSITDQGFNYWSLVPGFCQLTKLILADCTFLSDSSIISLIGAAKNLLHLNLSFCCSLSDVSVEVISLGLPRLKYLNLSFCGSAVGDHGMNALALHLYELQQLSVRGCVRVTKLGINKVLEQCENLKELNISQCRNSQGW